jgi:hypothetical protein
MSDVNRRNTAGWLTDEAKRLITTERADQHGDAAESFAMIAELWTVYLAHTNKMGYGSPRSVVITPRDVAEMMSLLKKARKVYGSGSAENYIDDIGYTALGGSMVVHDIIKEEAHKAVNEDNAAQQAVQYAGSPVNDLRALKEAMAAKARAEQRDFDQAGPYISKEEVDRITKLQTKQQQDAYNSAVAAQEYPYTPPKGLTPK